MHELTGFQRDLLVVIASEEGQSGLDIKEKMEPRYNKEIHHGRLYPNLDSLVDQGLVNKGKHDQRTNTYDISQEGADLLTSHYSWVSESISGL